MAEKPVRPFSEFGVTAAKTHGNMNPDEFIRELRGTRAIKKYREMCDNDAIIGAGLMAMDMMLRGVEWNVESVDDTPAAKDEQEFVEGVFEDMSHTWEEFLSEVLTFLPYGFSFHETVYKRRRGYQARSASSRFNDGLIGIRKLAPRAQWTIEEFKLDDAGGIMGVVQNTAYKHTFIPISKGLLFRTVSQNNNPIGRSVLRNVYRSYYYANNVEEVESIAIERELNGLPVGRIPGEFLRTGATDGQVAMRNQFETILRDVKFNEQGYVLMPSDVFEDDDGRPTGQRMFDIELMASNGTRDIDTNKIVVRYQQNMARAMLADFLMLGQTERGSFALSKNKTDLFLSAIQGHLGSVAAIINRHLLPRLWMLNGKDMDLMPQLRTGRVAPQALGEVAEYLKGLAAAGMPLFPDQDLENVLRDLAHLPHSTVQEETDIDSDTLGTTSGDKDKETTSTPQVAPQPSGGGPAE